MELKRTPLYESHKSLGAKIVPFAGWEMPVQYSGLIDEHLTVRNSCGLFDVSHMGEIEVTGKDALGFAQLVMTNDIERVVDGQCQYTILCYPEGGVVDDCIVYRFGKERFLFVVNASNTDKAFDWLKSQAKGAVEVKNVSGNYAQLALQGPNALEAIRPLLSVAPESIKHFHFVVAKVCGVEAIVSRTGYTGEDGFELYFEPKEAPKVWQELMASGKKFGILPIGLGARDTLRLEMGYPLYGHELSETITPIEAGLGKYVKFTRDFIGRAVLEKQVKEGVKRSLVGFKLIDPGIARSDYEIVYDGKKTGWVSSGTLSPSLRSSVGMGFVEPGLSNIDTEIGIMIRGRAAKARVVKVPFYNRAVGVTAS